MKGWENTTAWGRSKRGRYSTLRETLSEAATAGWGRMKGWAASAPWEGVGTARPGDVLVLKDVSFTIEPGEVVGIIGPNGAGKSTLLKIISHITEPTAGQVRLRGRVGSLLEVGTGFHQELTGRENVFLNGAILGMGRREIARKFDEIVAFAEIDKFIDTPVKRDSSGMQVRLAFSVAAHLDPSILLIDEVLAVGDLRFQRKCMDYAKSLYTRGATVLLVSHNMFAIKAICNRAILLCHGRQCFDGVPEEAIQLYEKESRLGTLPWAQGMLGRDPSRCPVSIKDVEVLDEAGRPRTVFEFGERLRVRLHFETSQRLDDANFVVSVLRSDDVACCNYNTARTSSPCRRCPEAAPSSFSRRRSSSSPSCMPSRCWCGTPLSNGSIAPRWGQRFTSSTIS